MRIHLAIFLLFLLSFVMPVAASAQELLDEQDFNAGASIDFDDESFQPGAQPELNTEESDFVSDEPEVTIIKDPYVGKYLHPSVQNLSKLYWRMGILKTENDTAVDNYLLINECDIYEKFFKDDFEWSRIRDAAAQMLDENKEAFSRHFKIVIPVDLGRYDMERGGFPLDSKTEFKDLRRVEVGGADNNDRLCGKDFAIEHYPRNMVLILSKPFNFDFLELDEHVAQAFIIRRKYDDVKIPLTMRYRDFDRIVFARLRVELTNYRGSAKGSDNLPLAIMFGNIKGIDFFEDPYEKRALKIIDF
jgi:hypothetical protein